MLEYIILLCVFVWVPIFLYHSFTRSFTIFLIWLAVAPIVNNIIERPYSNPFFPMERAEEVDYISGESPNKKKDDKDHHYFKSESASIKIQELLQPTRCLLVLFLIVLLLDALLRGKSLLPLNRTEVWMLIFSLILILNVLMQARRLAYGLRIATDAFIVPFLAYYVTRRFVRDAQHFRQFVKTIGYVGFGLILLALMERMVHGEIFHRLQGPFEFRDLLYIAIMAAFFMMLSDQSRDPRMSGVARTLPRGVRMCVLWLTPMIVLLTWTRGNWLGFLCGIWTFIFFARHLLAFSQKLIAVALVLLLIPMLGLAVQLLAPQDIVENRLANDRTVYGRFGAWQIAIAEGLKNPFFGIGLNSLRDVLATKKVWVEGKRSASHAHNSLLAISVELGLLGVLAYLAMIGSMIAMGIRIYQTNSYLQGRWWGVAVVAITVAHFLSSMTSTILYKPDVSHVYVFASLGSIAARYGISKCLETRQVRRLSPVEVISTSLPSPFISSL